MGILNRQMSASNTESIGFVASTSSAFGSVAASTPAATFGTLLTDIAGFSGSIMAEALSHFGKVESVQKPKLLGIAGTDVTLIDG